MKKINTYSVFSEKNFIFQEKMISEDIVSLEEEKEKLESLKTEFPYNYRKEKGPKINHYFGGNLNSAYAASPSYRPAWETNNWEHRLLESGDDPDKLRAFLNEFANNPEEKNNVLYEASAWINELMRPENAMGYLGSELLWNNEKNKVTVNAFMLINPSSHIGGLRTMTTNTVALTAQADYVRKILQGKQNKIDVYVNVYGIYSTGISSDGMNMKTGQYFSGVPGLENHGFDARTSDSETFEGSSVLGGGGRAGIRYTYSPTGRKLSFVADLGAELASEGVLEGMYRNMSENNKEKYDESVEEATEKGMTPTKYKYGNMAFPLDITIKHGDIMNGSDVIEVGTHLKFNVTELLMNPKTLQAAKEIGLFANVRLSDDFLGYVNAKTLSVFGKDLGKNWDFNVGAHWDAWKADDGAVILKVDAGFGASVAPLYHQDGKDYTGVSPALKVGVRANIGEMFKR